MSGSGERNLHRARHRIAALAFVEHPVAALDALFRQLAVCGLVLRIGRIELGAACSTSPLRLSRSAWMLAISASTALRIERGPCAGLGVGSLSS